MKRRPVTTARPGLVVAGCALVLLAAPSSASGHASLLTATPRLSEVLPTAPHVLRLEFDEDVVPRYARVAVVGAHGQNLAGPPRVTGSVVTVALAPAPLGSYTVRWRMVASNDGHATQGAYSYGVRVRPLPPAPLKGISVPVAPEALAWLQFLGIVLAGGMLTFRAIVWAHAAQLRSQAGAPDAPLAIWLGMAGAALALHAGVLGFLTGAYPIVGGSLSSFVNTEIEPIRVGTHLGQAWTVTTFAWLGVLALLVGAWVTPRRRERLLAGAGAMALASAFGLSWASHPASRGTPALLADFVHLVAAALWVGGVVAIVVLVASTRSLPQTARDAIARASVSRFSSLALPTVVLVTLAGAYLALRELPAPSALASSRYGVTLLVKSGVALGAVGLGAYHRRFVVPRLAAGEPVAGLRRTLGLELGFLLGVLALGAILSQTTPRA